MKEKNDKPKKLNAKQFLEEIKEVVKKCATPEDRPMVHVNASSGRQMLLIGDEPLGFRIRSVLHFSVLAFNNPEIVFVMNSYMSERPTDEKIKSGDFVRPRDDPNRKEVFILGYFSPDKEMSLIMKYKTVKGKIQWGEEISDYEGKAQHLNSFNPYKYSKEEIERITDLLQIDQLMINGKKEVYDLLHGVKVEVYRDKNTMYFRALRSNKEVFIESKIMPRDSKQEAKLRDTLQFLRNKKALISYLKKELQSSVKEGEGKT